MSTDDALPKHTEQNREGFEGFVSRLEGIGLSAARLILSVTVTIAVVFIVIDVVGLAIEGVRYERATSQSKYQISSVSYNPQFSNVRLSGKAQIDGDGALTEDRSAAASKTRDQLLADRLAYLSEAGLCIGAVDGQCPNLQKQREALASDWESVDIHHSLSAGGSVSYANALNFPDLSAYYGSYGFSSAEDSLKAEWDAVNNCLGAYKGKNGNLYLQKAPELFDAIAAECDATYLSAVQTELNNRPNDWSVLDTFQFMAMVWTLVGLGATIITIALTIIFFRLEVSFRALRNLDRLK